jgi:hypothetical protein
MILTPDALTLVGLAALALFFICCGIVVGVRLAHKDYNDAFAKGREAGVRGAREFFTEKIQSGDITFSTRIGKKGK